MKAKERLRRTMLFVPGNNPGMVRDAYIYQNDSIMFDLEDSVSLTEKDSARFLVYSALKALDYGDKEIVIRINPLNTPEGIQDLEAMIRARADVIRLPKTETAEDILTCDREITRIEKDIGAEIGSTRMMAAIESAEGALNAREIAKASKRLVGIAIGAEDYVTDLKTSRSKEGMELFMGRSLVLLAARAAGIDAIDTVFSDVNDMDGLYEETKRIKELGFDGKSVINPRQIAVVHDVFTPTEKEIRHAEAVMEAIEEANRRGSGVISLNGKMVDKPIVERAKRIIRLAQTLKVV